MNTTWMPHPRRWNSMNAASTPYDQRENDRHRPLIAVAYGATANTAFPISGRTGGLAIEKNNSRRAHDHSYGEDRR
jgi:hypothetical protein